MVNSIENGARRHTDFQSVGVFYLTKERKFWLFEHWAAKKPNK